MPIPCYFADFWKECVNKRDFSYAQLGFGLNEDGSARVSHTSLPALSVIDDSIMGKATNAALDTLAQHCKNGCYLDFERSCSKGHIALIAGLRKRIGGFFALPVRYLPYAPKAVPIINCPRPCNSWRSFVQNLHRHYPNGWMLELIPWKHISPCRMKQSRGRLTGAVCEYRCENGVTQYYDTKETLREKIKIAEQFGCIAAICLYQEWTQLAE